VTLYAQNNTGVSTFAEFNTNTKGLGVGLNLQIPVSDKIYIVPSVSFYPEFNDIDEINGGIFLQVDALRKKKLNVYLAGGVFINHYFSYPEYPQIRDEEKFIAPDIGLGLIFGGHCIRPFVEPHFNAKNSELFLRFGIITFPGCLAKSGNSGNCSRGRCYAY
jgi:hypothetical protein